MDNLEEMDKLLEMYNLPRLNQEEIENMNRPTTSNETQSVIKKKKFQQTKVQDQVASTGEFCQTFVEELTQIFLKPCQKIAEEGTLLDSFYEARITPKPKPDKDLTYRSISLRNINVNIFNILNKILANQFNNTVH